MALGLQGSERVRLGKSKEEITRVRPDLRLTCEKNDMIGVYGYFDSLIKHCILMPSRGNCTSWKANGPGLWRSENSQDTTTGPEAF